MKGTPSQVVVELAPGRDAVDVVDVRRLAERLELVPGERLLLFDEAPDVEVPGLEVDARDAAVVQHGPAGGEVLPGRESELAIGPHFLRGLLGHGSESPECIHSGR